MKSQKLKVTTSLTILGNNTAGLSGKIESLTRSIDVFDAAVVMLQETKLKSKGKVKLKGFEIFEQPRQNKDGGGLMTIVHKNLKPVEVPDENCEFLLVDLKGDFGSICTINCYGPQESLALELRSQFFIELESRIITAKNAGKLVCLEFDANSKLGHQVIKEDPHDMSSNGSLLSSLVERQNLIVVNASNLCFGTITRYRKTKNAEEKSVLDYFVVCQDLYKSVSKMFVDEERKYVLTKFFKCKKQTITTESDHNVLVLYLDIKFSSKTPVNRSEIYALRNPESLQVFKENTMVNDAFIKALEANKANRGGYLWLKELKHVISKSFKRIKISNKKETLPCQLKILFQEREKLRSSLTSYTATNDEKSVVMEKIKKVEENIADIKAEQHYKIVNEAVKHLVDNTENMNTLKMWQLRRRISNKNSDVPVAKMNENGILITEPSQILKLYENTYKNRLRHRQIRPQLSLMYTLKMNLFALRFEVCKNIKSEKWTDADLTKVLKSLKLRKSADANGLIYELFRPEVIGDDLLKSLLMLCNNVKDQLIIPEFMKITNITSLYKMKGPHCDLNSERGIFSVSKIRSIIEKLISQKYFDIIDDAMSDSNVGGRKNRNIRDNLYVIYAIANDVIKKKKSINIQFYDISKCFDAMWAEDTMNDLYDAGVKDDIFSLVSMLNEECQVKVKTPVGSTEKFILNDIEMQGTVLAPLKCAVQMDTLGKYCYTYSTGLYKYKETCYVPPLGMIDDIAGVSECNEKSIIQNAIINAKVESKKQEFNVMKCAQLHIGPNKDVCPDLKVHESPMPRSDTQKYLGDVISSAGNNNANITDRCKTGHAAIAQIKSLLAEGQFGKFVIQTGLVLRDSVFVSKILLNSEVWHALTKTQIESLELIDRILLRNILNAHSKTGIEWLYADTGKLPLKYLIQYRRLLYLWHILNRDDSELIKRIYISQKNAPVYGDWVKMIDQDKSDLGIDLTETDIQRYSKDVFKSFVKKKIHAKHLSNLSEMKIKHSKSKFLDCSMLKPAEYIVSQKFTTREKRLLFRLRSRTLELKGNFPGQFQDLICRTCGLADETQHHLLQCEAITSKLGYVQQQISDLDEHLIYGNAEEQAVIVKVFSDILEARDALLSSSPSS